jgi:hypothetical protein
MCYYIARKVAVLSMRPDLPVAEPVIATAQEPAISCKHERVSKRGESRRLKRRLRLPALAVVAMSALPLRAEPAGPPVPTATKDSPAQQAMLDYKRNFGPVPLPAPCQRPKDNEVIVCGVGGRGGSPDRLPLPAERGPPDHPRLAVGEVRPDMSAPPGMSSCASQDPGTRCGGSVDLIGAAIAGVRLVRALVDRDSIEK